MVLKVQSAAAMKRQATLNQKRILHEQQQQAKLDRWCEEHNPIRRNQKSDKEL